MAFGTMWCTQGRVVVYRNNPAIKAHADRKRGPRVGIIIGETDDGLLKIRPACGNRRYMASIVILAAEFVARDATEREATLGYPVDPVSPQPQGGQS